MVSTKDILDYYAFLENLYDYNSEEYIKLRLQAEKAFLNSSDYQKEVDNVLFLDSYNSHAQNSLIVWKFLDGEEIEDDNELLKTFETTITNDRIRNIILSEDSLASVREPIGVKFKSEQIKRNFVLSRAIFMAKCGYTMKPNKEYLISLINEGILSDVQKIMRYLHRTVVMDIKSTSKISIVKEHVQKDWKTAYDELAKLQGIFNNLKLEYKTELKRYGNISL